MEIKAKVRKFIETNLIVFDDEAEFSDEDNIFQMGFVSSLFAMQMVIFIEKEFNICVDDEDLEISNFSSVNNIHAFVEKKLNR